MELYIFSILPHVSYIVVFKDDYDQLQIVISANDFF